MLDLCQEWCERSRMQINVDKTNTMSFFPDATSAHLQWHINHRFPTPRHSTLERVTCFKYLSVPLDETLSMTPLQDDILEKILQLLFSRVLRFKPTLYIT